MDNIARFKTDNSLRRFDEKQEIEIRAVLKKFKSGKDDIEKKQVSDLDKIIKKYQALKENQSKAQKAEIIELERGFMSFKPFSNLFGRSSTGIVKSSAQGGSSNREYEEHNEGDHYMEEQPEEFDEDQAN